MLFNLKFFYLKSLYSTVPYAAQSTQKYGALHYLVHLYILKNVKNTHGEMLILVKLQAEA